MKRAVAILVLIMLAAGCARATTTPLPLTSPLQTTLPAAPPASTSAAPSVPAAEARSVQAPAARSLSFVPATYTNDTIGFTFQYPDDWVKAEVSGDMVIKVQIRPGQGADTALVMIIPEAADFSSAARDGFKATFGSGAMISKVDAAPARAVTLADGVTPATESIITTRIRDIVDVYCYAIGFNKGGKTIIAFGATLLGDTSKSLVKEIAQTLAVKQP